MDDNTEQPFYLFLHIPKTGGTTFRYIVDHHFGPENIITYYNQPSVQLLDNLDVHLKVHPNYQAIIGHFSFGLHKKLTRPAPYITFLRHPVARTISHYKEWLINNLTALQDSSGATKTLSESVLTNPEHYTDYQTNFLVDSDTRQMSKSSISDLALENLDKYFEGIGLVEHFDQSIALIARYFDWPTLEYKKRNVKNIEVEVTPELVDQILAINENDLIIYESVEKKLLAKFKILKERSEVN
jgi:hypothetical protein